MKKRGRPVVAIQLAPQVEAELNRLARSSRSQRHVAFRAPIVLACAEGLDNVNHSSPPAGRSAYGGQVAQEIRGPRSGWVAGRAAAGETKASAG